MVFCTTLSKKVESLEVDLKQTKQIYGTAYTKLIKKVKKLEKKVKLTQARRKARIVVSDDEDDIKDSSKQGRKIAAIDQDPAISLVQHDTEIQGRNKHDVEIDTAEPVYTASAVVTTANIAISNASHTRVSITDDITMAETLPKTKLQQEQERLGFKAAVRLQVELEEEDRTVPKLEARSSKRDGKEELDQESSKRQKTGESSELRDKDDDELSQEKLQ
nr:hypothetical protein [Tanacetum cinerariifolium]